MQNPVNYFEIPVNDLPRAVKFYESVLVCKLETKTIDGNQMAVFHGSLDGPGIFGALALGPSYKPSTDGTRIYFATKSIDTVLGRVLENGGRIEYPKTDVGEIGFVAEFIDSEGNRIALHEPPVPK
ncbi:MAG: VOC family protein [Acidobacteria bacterium]|nr:VOC family protein [Acidobacteriota bacterium]